jgi:hypothetical protein
MSVVVDPSARETFTPRELTDAYKQFIERGPQYLDTETGIKAAAYCFDERVLLVYEEPETGLVVLIHPSAWKGNSPKFAVDTPRPMLSLRGRTPRLLRGLAQRLGTALSTCRQSEKATTATIDRTANRNTQDVWSAGRAAAVYWRPSGTLRIVHCPRETNRQSESTQGAQRSP